MKEGDFRVLVIDDEPAVLSMLADMIRHQGYAVAVAAGGKEALRRFEELHPHLIVLDVNMPDMDGYEVLKAIRVQSDIPVIMLTGYAKLKDAIALEEHEVPDAFLRKPLEIRRLPETIRYLLSQTSPEAAVAFHRSRLWRIPASWQEWVVYVFLAGALQAGVLAPLAALASVFLPFSLMGAASPGDIDFLSFLRVLFVFALGGGVAGYCYRRSPGLRGGVAFLCMCAFDAIQAMRLDIPGMLAWEGTSVFLTPLLVIAGTVTCMVAGCVCGHTAGELKQWLVDEVKEFRASVRPSRGEGRS